jgi:hypothetical protein
MKIEELLKWLASLPL